MLVNKIKSNVVDVSLDTSVEVSLEDFIKNGQTIPVSVFKKSSIGVAIQDALLYLGARGGGAIEIPPSEGVVNSLMVVLQKDMNQVLKDTFLYNNYRYPLNAEGRPYTGDSWKVGDMVINSDITNDKCVGWVCIDGGIPGVWKEYGILEGFVQIPQATETVLGGIKASPKTTESVEVVIDAVSGKLFVPDQTDTYTLPQATNTVLGGIKAKSKTTESVEVAIDGTSGKLFVPDQTDTYILPIATDTVLGGIKAKSKTTESVEVSVDGTGKLFVPDQTDTYTLPIATSVVLGGVKAIAKTDETVEVSVDGTGKLFVPDQTDTYTLPQATDTVLGGIKAKSKTTESSEVAIDGTSGKLFVSNLSANGLVTGGSTGQVLSKIDGVDYNVQWTTLPKEIVNKTPVSATDVGTAGEVCWDADYLYVCVATNVWKRTAITTW